MAVIANRRAYVTGLYGYGEHQAPPGTTSNTGTPNTPVRRRVRLHDQRDGRLVREMWSDATNGGYQFRDLPAGTYYVTAFDHTGQYGGVVETDIVVPTP